MSDAETARRWAAEYFADREPGVLSAGAHMVSFDLTPEERQYLDTRRANRLDTFRLWQNPNPFPKFRIWGKR